MKGIEMIITNKLYICESSASYLLQHLNLLWSEQPFQKGSNFTIVVNLYNMAIKITIVE